MAIVLLPQLIIDEITDTAAATNLLAVLVEPDPSEPDIHFYDKNMNHVGRLKYKITTGGMSIDREAVFGPATLGDFLKELRTRIKKMKPPRKTLSPNPNAN